MTTAAEDRTLILLRHAEAEPTGDAGDHERELTDSGRRDAEEAGKWLRDNGIGIDEVLCSTALRTQQTAEGVWDGGCAEADVRLDRRIYDATPETLLEVIGEADHDANVVMLVGHAPGVQVLASTLADGEGSREAHDAMSQGFPAATIAMLRFSGHWSDLGPGDAVLDRFHVCRG